MTYNNLNEAFMRRCFDLALLGKGAVAPNPMVGAVLVYNNIIIGEGYHAYFGGPHAEVNAVNSVPQNKKHLICKSTLYVSLEPCNFVGKTPACTSLIKRERIPKVVISALDLTPQVAGKSVKMLRETGVEVVTGVLEKEGQAVARIRSAVVTNNRPYVLLKFAQTADGFFAPLDESQFWITSPLSKHLVHKWRGESNAIMVGTNTARIDNPQLTNRLFWGSNPLRIVLDQNGTLPMDLHLMDNKVPTLVVTDSKVEHPKSQENLNYWSTTFDEDLLPNLMQYLYERKVGVLMVEGGAKLLKSFLKKNIWDEARILTSDKFLLNGIEAPKMPKKPEKKAQYGKDAILFFYNS